MTIRPMPFGAALPAPRFGMTPEQQKKTREKIFDTLYPHLDSALRGVNTSLIKQDTKGNLNLYGQLAVMTVQTMAQLSTFQEAPQRPDEASQQPGGFDQFI